MPGGIQWGLCTLHCPGPRGHVRADIQSAVCPGSRPQPQAGGPFSNPRAATWTQRPPSLRYDGCPGRQRLTSLQDGPNEWAASQSQGSHPVPLASCQVLGTQRSQLWPVTFGRQRHCPVVLSHWQSEPLQRSCTVPR